MGGGRRGSDHLPQELANEADTSSDSDPYSSDFFPSVCYSNLGPEPADDESLRRRSKTYSEVLKSYVTPRRMRPRALRVAKHIICWPCAWIEEVGGTKARDYDIPETMTLLLVGPRGSGKSTLVNRITRVFQDDQFAPDRAQVSHNVSVTEGSCFLQEYMIPRDSKKLCVYDTRSLSTFSSDNFKLLQDWMMHGVTHRQMVIRDSDDVITTNRIKDMAREGFGPCQKRMVNFVIFVVDGISVLKSIDSMDTRYNDMLAETFNYPFLSFRDNKPVVVVTHGDELSLFERAHIRTYLGELLGIPPLTQIFDIPGTNERDTEVAVVDMLHYSIEHAYRNLPFKHNFVIEAERILTRLADKLESFHSIVELVMIFLWFYLLLLLGMKCLVKW
ncbi:uncharacterized protein LOC103700848 isoform X2 [Phoenix dactylifera]|uniref:Uncharacterized protein LOC103700848 isoform X2 n=1 Tax=Phoenix dactylifera TaxID=42345 RepID=A0A8B7BLF1_PHODC|nr:uncharacterized protein LOC103700848 isoform X2 [Phoenix dactylifera]